MQPFHFVFGTCVCPLTGVPRISSDRHRMTCSVLPTSSGPEVSASRRWERPRSLPCRGTSDLRSPRARADVDACPATFSARPSAFSARQRTYARARASQASAHGPRVSRFSGVPSWSREASQVGSAPKCSSSQACRGGAPSSAAQTLIPSPRRRRLLE